MEKFKPYPYQMAAIDYVMARPYCALFLDMGLGKTVCTLTALHRLIDTCEVCKVLVVAPKKVAESTWADEVKKWQHLTDLRVSTVLGTARQREQALLADADVYVTGRDNFAWLCDVYGYKLPFDTLILDELTSFKSPKSQRFKALKKVRPFLSRVVGLTGTPAPNGLKDLWAQIYALDLGKRLGFTNGAYIRAYFDTYSSGGHLVRCTEKRGADKVIFSKIADIVMSMKAADYLTLPACRELTTYIELPAPVRKRYNDFERENVLQFIEETDGAADNVVANNAAALCGKLSQFANGAVYDEDHQPHEVHREKLAALVEFVEAANGLPVLVFYQYKHDRDRITAALKGYNVRTYANADDLTDWNAGKIEVLLAHPASTAYGLNMQHGGHIIAWFGTGWNLEQYQQANARLNRQGQTRPVTITRLIARGTMDEDMAAALTRKERGQEALLRAVNKRINKIQGNE